MEIHRLKSDQIPSFCSNANEAKILLLLGLASFFANEKLFGGTESINYKIKKKHFWTRGRQILEYLSSKN